MLTPEQRKEYNRKWRANNKDKVRGYNKKYYANNPNKRREQNKRWRDANPDKLLPRPRKLYHLKNTYGILEETYFSLLDNQNNTCAICGKDGNLHVDHCHKTGVVRGLLCLVCNTSLGGFKDDPTLLRKAAKYLESNQPPQGTN